jgi:heat shock protein HtpX
VILERAVRRNQRRAAALAIVAALNTWAMLSIIAGVVGWWLFGSGLSAGAVALGGAALGAVTTLCVVLMQLGIKDRTLKILGAVELAAGELPRVEILLSELAIATGTAPVTAALLDDEAPNALAVGVRPSSTTIVVTTGLVEKLTRDELEAVLAAELCAVRRFDTALRTIAVGATSLSGSAYRLFHDGLERGQPWYSRLDWSAWAMVVMTWPTMVAGRAVRRSVLRSFDFGADEMAVAITRHPEALASALRKLRDDRTVVRGLTFRTAPLWFEPIPNDETIPGFEWGRYAYAPTLDERLERVMASASF